MVLDLITEKEIEVNVLVPRLIIFIITCTT